MIIQLRSGNLTGLKPVVDAVFVPIDENQRWYSPTDKAIKSCSQHYHGVAASVLATSTLSAGNVMYIVGPPNNHKCPFRDVIMGIDDLTTDFSELVYKSLIASRDSRNKTLVIPVMRGPQGEEPFDEVSKAIIAGLVRFKRESPAYDITVSLVLIETKTNKGRKLKEQEQALMGQLRAANLV